MIEKIIRKIKRKIEKIYMKIKYYLNFNTLKNEQKLKKENWVAYTYVNRKYKKYLDKLEYNRNTNEFSNIIWWCWLQGEENAPDLNKACLNSLRKNLTDRKIIVVTEKNYNEYVKLPDYIEKKYKKGFISKTHFSDILRANLLLNHGGTWVDSSVLCTSYNKDFFDKNLFVFQNWKTGEEAVKASSWFITAEKNNPIIKDVTILLNEYWRKKDYEVNYFLFHLFFTMAVNKYQEQWSQMNRFSNIPPHMLQFELLEKYSKERFEQIEKMSSIHKLNQKLDFSKCNGNTNYDYIINKYLNHK